MMLKYSFGMNDAYDAIFKSIEKVLQQGYRTGDIMSQGKKQVGTAEMGDLIVKNLKKISRLQWSRLKFIFSASVQSCFWLFQRELPLP
jgi:transcriptional regulator NrdR family protein